MTRDVAIRCICVAVAGLIACSMPNAPVQAEPKAQAKKAAEPQVRYFNLSPDVFPDLDSEVYLQETRQGAKLVSAQIEVCHLLAPGSSRRDRFVVPLKVEGNRLTGSGQTQEGKSAVSINLTRTGTAASGAFAGIISSGDIKAEMDSTDNAAITAEDYAETMKPDDVIEAAPAEFTEFSPQLLNVRITRAGLPGLVNALRDLNVRLDYSTLESSCQVLRSGTHTVQIGTAPDRTVAVLAAIKSLPGVTATGYASIRHRMDRALLFPSAGWRGTDGSLERIKFADSLGRMMAKALGAATDKSSWDERLGELSIILKRPHDAIAGLKLQQVMTITVLVGPLAPGNRERSILWIEHVTWQLIEERFGARLEFRLPTNEHDSDPPDPEGIATLAKALAVELKGQVWDQDSDSWQ